MAVDSATTAGPQPQGRSTAEDGRPRDLSRRGMRDAQGKKVADRRLRDRGRRAPASASRRLIRQHQAARMQRSQPVTENPGSRTPRRRSRVQRQHRHNRHNTNIRKLAPGHDQTEKARYKVHPRDRALRQWDPRRPVIGCGPTFSRRRSGCVLQQRGDQCIRCLEPPAAHLRRDHRFHGLQLLRDIHRR